MIGAAISFFPVCFFYWFISVSDSFFFYPYFLFLFSLPTKKNTNTTNNFIQQYSGSSITQLSERDEHKVRPHWGADAHGEHH